MRVGVALGIIVVLAALLQGCGHKGPLTLPSGKDTSTQSGK
ncbi:MAG: lipoprotein [Gallionellaceae bacterium]|jgi:predicted small lipoprotein YifL|nr:lipoprotein [Gallionellaceae bacterium]